MTGRAIILIGVIVIVSGIPAGAQEPASKPPVIVSGGGHSCRTTPEQKAVCWGNNRYGQLGNRTTEDSEAPAAVSRLTNVAKLAAGDWHTCAAMATGQVECWGRNDRGQLASLSMRSSSTPVKTPVGPATQIVAGDNHTCALFINAAVICWGDNGAGQIGLKPSPGKPSLPVVVPNIADAIAIAAGSEHSCAVQKDGKVLCWGDNHFGQLGFGDQEDHSYPSRPVPIAGEAIAVTAGRDHTCALLRDKTVQCWGEGLKGQLGDGLKKNSLQPVRVMVPDPGGAVPLGKVASISAGREHTCALLENREVFCWGGNSLGQLGTGKDPWAATPVFSGLADVVSLGSGGFHTCAVLSSGETKCLGPVQVTKEMD